VNRPVAVRHQSGVGRVRSENLCSGVAGGLSLTSAAFQLVSVVGIRRRLQRQVGSGIGKSLTPTGLGRSAQSDAAGPLRARLPTLARTPDPTPTPARRPRTSPAPTRRPAGGIGHSQARTVCRDRASRREANVIRVTTSNVDTAPGSAFRDTRTSPAERLDPSRRRPRRRGGLGTGASDGNSRCPPPDRPVCAAPGLQPPENTRRKVELSHAGSGRIVRPGTTYERKLRWH
jgi:hypothetical protein